MALKTVKSTISPTEKKVMKIKTISIIVPVYRNRGSINKTYINILKVLKSLKQDYEIIFVNDGSDDGSLEELLDIKEIDKKVTVIDFTRNFGQTSAIYAGFDIAKGDCIINLSADLQEPPLLLKEMIDKWKNGSRIVICARKKRNDSPLANIGSKIFYKIIKKSIPSMPDGGFDIFLLDREVYKRIASLNERSTFLQGDILWQGYKPEYIEYERLKREIGKSQWTFGKKLRYFMDGIINTSYWPIRLMSIIGVLTALIGFVYAFAIVIARFLNETPFNGYAPIMIVLLIVSGFIMIMLGVIGEYLWRIYEETRKRPRYVIKDVYKK